jgi:hypothetical protein
MLKPPDRAIQHVDRVDYRPLFRSIRNISQATHERDRRGGLDPLLAGGAHAVCSRMANSVAVLEVVFAENTMVLVNLFRPTVDHIWNIDRTRAAGVIGVRPCGEGDRMRGSARGGEQVRWTSWFRVAW